MSDKHSWNPSEIHAEACAWIVQLETGDMTRADIDALREWMQRSSAHVKEIRRLARVSAQTNVLTEMAGPLRAAAAHYRDVVRPAPRGWRIAKPWIGAVASVLVLAAVLVFNAERTSAPQGPVLLTTAMGEYRQEIMVDGSVLALNTNSRLEVLYSTDQRRVRLLQGEALFTVAKNTDRPFVVYAGDRIIEAVGTAFLVRIDEGSFELAVTEGQVRVADILTLPELASPSLEQQDRPGTDISIGEPEDATDSAFSGSGIEAAAEPIYLNAGQQFVVPAVEQATLSVAPVVEPITPRDIQRKLAWQEGLLDFSDTPLREVIREVSRHTALEIEIVDPELSELKFGGIFRTGDTEVLFKALKTAYGIDVKQSGDIIRLTRPPRG